MINNKNKLRQYTYRAKQAEAENEAIKSSKAYKIAKLASHLKNKARNDPIGLTKKIAKTILKNPRNLLLKGKNGLVITQGLADMASKYQEWILLNEPDVDDLDRQRMASEILDYKPIISIITPVFNPPIYAIEELIESVLEQTYPHFELCLGNFTDDKEVISVLEYYSKIDSRIKYWQFPENKGIAGNSNQILEKATGEYIALLDHDDTLSHDALYENVIALNTKKYDFIYSDKDKIDENGNRFDPMFKPGWSPEMMLNVNYLTHLDVMKTTIVKKVGGWDPATDGAQDWDLFLKIMSITDNIYHIPKVLYHWRVIETSTALSIDTKPYALAGQRKAMDKFLKQKNIPGVSYHKKTELFIGWDSSANSTNPVVVITSSSVANTKRIIRHVRHEAPLALFIIDTPTIKETQDAFCKDNSIIDIISTIDVHLLALKSKLIEHPNTILLFINDSIRLKEGWYAGLTGWLLIPEVAVASGRLINQDDLIVDSGGVLTQGIYQPLFHGFPRYYQSYIGNAEWVRNVSVVSGNFIATKSSEFMEYLKRNDSAKLEDYFRWLRDRNQRIVLNPQSIGVVNSIDVLKEYVNSSRKYTEQRDFYSSSNVSLSDPMKLFDDELLVGVAEENTESLETYQRDAIILSRSYDISLEQLEANTLLVNSFKKIDNPHSVCWIVPSFDNVYAGLMNIFSFADFLLTEKGLDTTFYILKSGNDVTVEQNATIKAIPSLKKARFTAITDQYEITEPYDIGIATLWSTAFVLAKANTVHRKCYFIQDNETNFYPKGSVSALVSMSYRFGFYAIANTEGLLNMYSKQYGGNGVVVTSKVDLRKYYPNDDLHKSPKKPYRVFFYARPNMPRNAFELGVAGLIHLKQELGGSVEIITAGADWDPVAYGVGGLFTNLGKIQYEAVPKLYRSVDAGLMFMFSGHPGVTASELMASGCPVVVNEYDDKTWNELYINEETCLVSLPIASEIARNLKRCLEEQDLRQRLINGGLEKSKSFYGGYEKNRELAYKKILGS